MSDMRKKGEVLMQRYCILNVVRQGGMGIVYRGQDQETGNIVALKEMYAYADMPSTLARQKFEQEAATLRALSHPQIPRILDFFIDGDSYFMAMEFIEGENLEQLAYEYRSLSGQGVPTELVVDFGIQICAILRYLHEQNPPLLHRDIKPGNLIHRSESSQLVLVDFGLARGFDYDSQTTRTQAGTLGYAPQEQFDGAPEPRTDIYAVGATLYHMLSGKSPPVLEVCMVRNRHPALTAVVEKATQQTAADRYSSAADMEAALREVQRLLKAAAPPPVVAERPPKEQAVVAADPLPLRRSTLAWPVYAAVGLAVIGALTAWWFLH